MRLASCRAEVVGNTELEDIPRQVLKLVELGNLETVPICTVDGCLVCVHEFGYLSGGMVEHLLF